jgi:hypothetical protein
MRSEARLNRVSETLVGTSGAIAYCLSSEPESGIEEWS